MFGARYFPEGSLNFTENLLAGPEHHLAVTVADETGITRRVSRGELRLMVARAQSGLKALGVGRGDCVAGILPNNLEALVALLATASLGALWSSCSPDFGVAGIVDRIGQIEPKVLFASPVYVYSGKQHDISDRLLSIVEAVSSLTTVVCSGAAGKYSLPRVTVLAWNAFIDNTAETPNFERFPFNHPLYILYASGTTGLPKAIVHSAGGTLIQHRKEHVLHCDLRPGDVVSWYTNTAWMMYHWKISALASGASILLYDGAAIVKHLGGLDLGILWKVSEQAGVTHFGTSPKYLATLQEQGYRPADHHDLSALRSVLSAGAPVSPSQYDWIYDAIKRDMVFASISGGTEIIGCFLVGSPLHPVRRGHLTCKALGMAVDILDDRGASVIGRKGDLVCTQPFPSMPLKFWGENGLERYHAAYFGDRAEIWTHGDLAEQTIHGTGIIYGRTDTTLKPGGVRIGTAEIYRVIETFPEVQDTLVFGLPVDGDEEIVLCLVLDAADDLTDDLQSRIRVAVRAQASPRHVPHRIHRVNAVPYTLNGKQVEGAARARALGHPIKNLGSLANPECLEDYDALAAGGPA